ncbi:MAG: dephospho-CoA kinase [Fibrobacter sp.]|jgi:dephospho-CoA kinase|nr:dephospho-CoA kinase [Fibrobacter sp.]
MSAKIALAGYMGSGKSTVAGILAEAGAYIVDADREAKLLMQSDPEIKMKLNEIFGEQVFKNGSIAFDRLGSIVFGSIEELKKLNAVVHPPLLERLCFLMRHRREPVVLDAALIPLWHIEDWFDQRVWVSASFDVRLKRLLAKAGGLTEEAIRERMLLQEKLFQSPPEGIWRYIRNESSIKALRSEVLAWTGLSG